MRIGRIEITGGIGTRRVAKALMATLASGGCGTAHVAHNATPAVTHVCQAGQRVAINRELVRNSGLPDAVFQGAEAAAGENPVAWQFLAGARISSNATDKGAEVCIASVREICGNTPKCDQITAACGDGADAAREITSTYNQGVLQDLMPSLGTKDK